MSIKIGTITGNTTIGNYNTIRIEQGPGTSDVETNSAVITILQRLLDSQDIPWNQSTLELSAAAIREAVDVGCSRSRLARAVSTLRDTCTSALITTLGESSLKMLLAHFGLTT